MLLVLALLQSSLLTRPLYLEEEPPELRTAQHIQILYEGAEGAPASVSQSRPEAEELARDLHRRLAKGADFVELAYQYSMARSGTRGAVLGTFAAGMLAAPLDSFLFEARLGEVSQPLSTPSGFHLLRRTDTHAGVRQIFIEGVGQESRSRCEDILRRLRAGEDFAHLARRFSEDASGARGGQYQVFERGPDDRLLKKAAFEIEVGQFTGPVESPLGLHILQRVPVETIDPALRESNFIAARGILIAFQGAVGAQTLIQRTQTEARALAERVYVRMLSGEPMSVVAADVNDDPGGRRRHGRLGWIHRGNPDLPVFMERLFNAPVGQVQAPELTTAGYVILLRER